MADLHEEIRSLTELVDEVTKVSIMLRGTQTQPGLIQQLRDATDAAIEATARLETAQGLNAKVDGLNDQFEKLPDRLFSKVNSLTFRSAVSEIMSEETGTAIEKIHDATLDHLESGVTRLADRLADDLFTKKIEPAMRNLETIARLKQDREAYRVRAENAEKALSDFQALSKKAEQSIIDQIKYIRDSSNKPKRWSLAAAFAIGIFMHGPVNSMVDSGLELLRETAKASVAAEKRSIW